MEREKLITSFYDTFEKSNSSLKQRTALAVKSNCVYKEGFNSTVKHRKEKASIDVCAGTTFAIAKRYRTLGKIAVLNFANPENPGGGVRNGAMAQEDCLCRSSNLYACISADNVFDAYYGYHRDIRNHFYTDRLIYTENVTVFKDDNVIPQMLPEAEWFEVDVITCAAPYLAKRKYTNSKVLLELFKSRAKNIFEAARDNNVDFLILGAFGCGAFKNPPEIVAKAFKEVIDENQYRSQFQKIVFAIKSTVNDNPFKPCPNLMAFETEFFGFSVEANKLRFSDPWPLAQAIGSIEMPSGKILKGGEQFNPYIKWKNNNKYFGKQFSIFGDSISTLEGYTLQGYKLFYFGDICERSGVKKMKDTWWDKVIGFFGGDLLVNNSWSGSRVTRLPHCNELFPSACSDERTSSLHINGVKPDVIIIYLGTNDWAFGANIGENIVLGVDQNEYFDAAYDAMLSKIKSNYPQSEIWCCTLCETYISKCPDFKFPHKHAGKHIEEYNEIIRNAVRKKQCRLIDLYNYKLAYDSIDGVHPNKDGMNTIATMVIRSVVCAEAGQYLDCEDGQHEYIVVEEYTGGTRYVCSRCGKTEHKSNLPLFEISNNQQHEELIVEENKNISSENEYVMLDTSVTSFLCSDKLRLTIESTGKTVQIQKNVVEVGRDKTCNFLLEGKLTVARRQATFLYEKKMWFLRDNFSTNGTWLNGARIQPGKKYQLTANDEINFAMAERVIFYKIENTTQPTGDPDAKALTFLEAGMEAFAKSDHRDEVALKLIIAALAFEKIFCQYCYTNDEMYLTDTTDILNNQLYTPDELVKFEGAQGYLDNLYNWGLTDIPQFLLDEKIDYFQHLADIYCEENIEIIKDYLIAHIAVRAIDKLDKDLYYQYLDITNELSGTTGYKTEEEMAVSNTSIYLDWPLSKLYCDKYVTEEDKQKISSVISKTIDEYKIMISEEDFLSEGTKANAINKLDNMVIKCMYPDEWYDYSELEFSGAYFDICIEISQFKVQDLIDQFHEPVDREKWQYTPITNNAFYQYNENSINILPGLIGDVLYNDDMKIEEVYAMLGVVIGHEISHGFDPNGAKYDEVGNYSDWWTKEDYAVFDELTKKLVDYYDGITIWEGLNCKGELVKSEVCADMAGVTCMLRLAAKEENFDYDLFFKSYSKLWAANSSTNMELYLGQYNEHPLNYLRVNVVVAQFDEFYETYDIKEGDGMYIAPENRVKIWD